MSNFAATQGEAIVLHEERDGAIASHVSEISPGDGTLSTSVSRSALREAMETDCGDSYPSAYVWSDGETLAVTDHQTAKLTPNADRLDEFGKVDIVRIGIGFDVLIYERPHSRTVVNGIYQTMTEYILDVHLIRHIHLHPLVFSREDIMYIRTFPKNRDKCVQLRIPL